MKQSLVHVTLVVKDYDETLEFYINKLNFVLISDLALPGTDDRWVEIAPPGSPGKEGTTIALSKANDTKRESFIGNQTGGKVFLFLGTADIWKDYDEMVSKGVEFVQSPVDQPYGIVAIFNDLYGNLWDFIQRK